MARYYFNTVDATRERDQNGLELRDVNAARKAAVRFMADLLRDDTDMVWDGRDFRIEVTDEADHSVLIVIAMAIDAKAVWPSTDGERQSFHTKKSAESPFID